MSLYAYDIYSGYLEESINVFGSRDKTLVERAQRLIDFSQRVMGMSAELTDGVSEALRRIIMSPSMERLDVAEAVAVSFILRDKGLRRFRIITDGRRDDVLDHAFGYLGHPEYALDFVDSDIGGMRPTEDSPVRIGYLDVNQIDALLSEAMCGDSYKTVRTAVIAGRISDMSRTEAEHALIDVGIETQGSVSPNIDYLIVGSKGTGGAKREKAGKISDMGGDITVLDEFGFEELLRAPKHPPEKWTSGERASYEDFVRSLRHVWAFGLDLYCISFPYDPEEDTFDDHD